ncbi:DNA-directed RNA polymerase I, subunit RPA34.5 [Zychaea mexicana]|uniref:DNA-directed RNA polymerase I, subunit RPA34.5 n=1 Tax=Zychaea mexicana TaxID=64656 RepID=UPI0022FDE153|nr:DNA-directed RNA polymerase I, subunit RPA34.5 [Zychaea mexicana]KAI9495821.1 DNA-directed RNA polymerase I, subunit RPA34.5 [Zychaea mexicana]
MVGEIYRAPSGFRTFKSSAESTFSSEKITAKKDSELWLIRVPNNVPLDKLNGLEIKLPSEKDSRKPLAKLNHKNEYALYRVPQEDDGKQDDDNDNDEGDNDMGISGQEMAGFTCLLPEGGYLAYAPKEFSQYMILDEQVNVPDSIEIAKEISSRPPAKRDQPENMKMRFKPYGFDTVGVPSNSTVGATAEVVSSSNAEATSKSSTGDKKRKRKDGEEKEKKKKSKKEKK